MVVVIKYTSILTYIYGLGIGVSTIYEIRNKNIILDKAIKDGKEVKYTDYAMNSLGGLFSGAYLGLFWPITIIGRASVKLIPEDKTK